MLKLDNIKIRKNLSNEDVFEIACKKYNINIKDVTSWNVSKRSIDARKKDDVHFNYSFDVFVKNEKLYKKYIFKTSNIKLNSITINRKSNYSPVIIGAGPAGLFAALTFVQNGIKPIIIEQGKTVEERKKDVDNFLKTGKLNTSSNVQFGEGGAGTFSDGKLTTGINNPLCKKVLDEFHKFGAPEQILYSSKPHIGTDNLIKIISNMRKYIIEHGGTFLFNEKVTDLEIDEGKIRSVICSKKIQTDTVILAIGHSARDTFEMLYSKGVLMERKNFSVGVRIEHLQSMINIAQYGDITTLKLPPAEYKLSYHSPSGRSCYTFCMCPGGVVMASSSEENTIVTNGMSYFARDGINSNSAVLVNVVPTDFEGKNPLAGLDFQKHLEQAAFKLGGNNYFAPVQKFSDFLNNTKSTSIGIIKPSYKPGITLSDLNTILPTFVAETLKEGILYFDTKLHGFANPDAILTGVETRSSSPVKIVRDELFVSNILGLYPCGEGPGYAGGIMSAAVDGIKCATAVLEKE